MKKRIFIVVLLSIIFALIVNIASNSFYEVLNQLKKETLEKINESEARQALNRALDIEGVNKKFVENDIVLNENIKSLNESLSSSVKQNLNNIFELEERIHQTVNEINGIKVKTDLINVQGDLGVSVIEASSSNMSIRLKPNSE